MRVSQSQGLTLAAALPGRMGFAALVNSPVPAEITDLMRLSDAGRLLRRIRNLRVVPHTDHAGRACLHAVEEAVRADKNLAKAESGILRYDATGVWKLDETLEILVGPGLEVARR